MMALLLMAGFYGFALTIACALLWAPFAEAQYLHRLDGRLAIFCIGGGLTILWALLPRADRFEAPGPRLTPSTAPHLFAIIEEVAQATDQPRPEEVYLLNDVNAFVTHRGGVMGFGSRRVMGVGLPLVRGLSIAELRSVIAHEFGHYVNGDVTLGPWIHKTRAAIGRTLAGVSGRRMLEELFNWYGRMFMRMTMQISREQEFVADATAARIAGTGPAISALRRVEVIALAYASYIEREVMPVVRAGFLPPVSEGFDLYLNQPNNRSTFHTAAENAALRDEVADFDSHPPMADRVAALERISAVAHRRTGDPIAPVLKDPDRHATALLEHAFGRDHLRTLKAITWAEVGAKVYGESWRAATKRHTKWLGTVSADRIPSDQAWFRLEGAKLVAGTPFQDTPPEYQAAVAENVLICAVGAALLGAGWTVETSPGCPVVVVRGDARFDVREAILKLSAGSMNADEWTAACTSMGIAAVPLAAS
jgi:Zn-dependent protease with chaperone function